MRNNYIKIILVFAVLQKVTSLYSQEPNKMESQIIETERGIIEYTLQGEGKTIIVIHGGNSNCFADVKQHHLISQGYQILIPSRPGYGKTSINFGRTVCEQTLFIKLLMDSLQIEKAAILANSAGGAVALEFVKQFPQKSVCLILEDAITKRWIPRYSPKYYAMKYIFQPKRQSKLWDRQYKEFENNRKKHLLRLCKMFSTLKPDLVIPEWSEEDLKGYGAELKASDSGYGFVCDIDHKAKDIHLITVPTLIGHSPFDKNVPFSHALYAKKRIPNSQLFIAPVKSHLIYMGKDYNYLLDKRITFLKESNW